MIIPNFPEFIWMFIKIYINILEKGYQVLVLIFDLTDLFRLRGKITKLLKCCSPSYFKMLLKPAPGLVA